MMMRFREWLADRLPWVQYPRQEFIPARPLPANPLSWEKRLIIGVLASLWLIFWLTILAGLLFLFYILFF